MRSTYHASKQGMSRSKVHPMATSWLLRPMRDCISCLVAACFPPTTAQMLAHGPAFPFGVVSWSHEQGSQQLLLLLIPCALPWRSGPLSHGMSMESPWGLWDSSFSDNDREQVRTVKDCMMIAGNYDLLVQLYCAVRCTGHAQFCQWPLCLETL